MPRSGPDGKPQKEYVVDFFEEKFCNKEAPSFPGSCSTPSIIRRSR